MSNRDNMSNISNGGGNLQDTPLQVAVKVVEVENVDGKSSECAQVSHDEDKRILKSQGKERKKKLNRRLKNKPINNMSHDGIKRQCESAAAKVV